MIKKWLYLLENIHKKPLGFGYRHENQTLFFFLKWKFIIEYLDFLWNFVLFHKVSEETEYF